MLEVFTKTKLLPKFVERRRGMKKGRLTAILWRNALVIAGLLSYMAATKNVYAAYGVSKVETSNATNITLLKK